MKEKSFLDVKQIYKYNLDTWLKNTLTFLLTSQILLKNFLSMSWNNLELNTNRQQIATNSCAWTNSHTLSPASLIKSSENTL